MGFELGLEERVGFENVEPKRTCPAVRTGTSLEVGAHGLVWERGTEPRLEYEPQSHDGIKGGSAT